MIYKLPRWVLAGAFVLAFVAGQVNVVGLLGFEHQAITHLTGTTSQLSAAMIAGDGGGALRFALMLGAFVAGCVLSGMLIQDSTLRLGRRYGLALLAVAALLAAAVPLLSRHELAGLALAAMACGLQNAMVTTYSGAVIRTTHLSGMFTDLGVFLGHALRGLPVEPRRLRLCLTVICGFFIGGLAGAWGFAHWGPLVLLLPSGLSAAVAMAYMLRRPQH